MENILFEKTPVPKAYMKHFINKPSGSSVRIGTGSNVKCGRLQRNTCITGVLRCNNCGYSNKHYI
jgi:hypothetical protein